MRDFTISSYRRYLQAMQAAGISFWRIDDYMAAAVKPEKFCMIRHDVDRRPQHALVMARVEQEMGIVATYYFRMKPESFNTDIIKEIYRMGHEVGYHYESLSDADGDMAAAIADFEKNLGIMRTLGPVKTISMHGRPFKPYDNRDIWRIKENHDLLASKYNILGEVYLDIDYSDIAYINDTGRNWTSGTSNVRDKVFSNIKADFASGEELLTYLQQGKHPKLVFQIHPERWAYSTGSYCVSFLHDLATNSVKFIMRLWK